MPARSVPVGPFHVPDRRSPLLLAVATATDAPVYVLVLLLVSVLFALVSAWLVEDVSSLLQRYDLLVSMRRRVVRRYVFIVLRRTRRAGRGLGRRQPAAESAADDVHDQEQAQQRQYRDQGDRRGAPTPRAVVTGRFVLLRRHDRANRTAGSGLGWQGVAASDRADRFSAAEQTSGLASARGARVRVPGRSFGMRSVLAIGAGSFTPTYRTAAPVRLVSVGAPFPASDQRRTVGLRGPALAERAVVLVHEQAPLAVQVALHLRADSLAGLVNHDRLVRGLVEGLGSPAGANLAAFLVPGEVAVRVAGRHRQTGIGLDGRQFGGRVLVSLLVGDAAANGTIVFVGLVSVFAVDRAAVHRRLARGLRLG